MVALVYRIAPIGFGFCGANELSELREDLTVAEYKYSVVE